MSPSLLRDVTANPLGNSSSGDVGFVIGIGVWLAVVIAAPLLVLILAVLLLSVEIPVAVALGLVLAVIRFAGIVPWTVTITDTFSGTESHDSYRNLIRAVRRIRAINTDRKVPVRWSWM
jgi:ABC-type transport system involved in multi-copper enzyme maturation permease subunit